jgi:hypothetical protein
MLELQFPDEISKNQWLTLVHTHITPFIQNEHHTNHNHPHHNHHNPLHHHHDHLSSQTPMHQNYHLPNLHYQMSTVSNSSINSSLSTSTSTSVSASATVPPVIKNTKQPSSSMMNHPKLTYTASSASRNSIDDVVSLHSSSNREEKSTSENDLQLSTDLANIIYSFNYLLEQSFCCTTAANLARSASSAGETITKSGQEAQISVPKRAETFNGASTTSSASTTTSSTASSASSSAHLQSNIMMMKTSASNNNVMLNIMNNLMNNNSKKATTNTATDHSSSSGTTTTSESETADSGYHSRLCMDFGPNQDLDNVSEVSCMCYANNNNSNNNRQLSELRKFLRSNKDSTASSSSSSSNTTTSVSKAHFEAILKVILNDYMRIKNENENLKRELDSKNNNTILRNNKSKVNASFFL